MHDPNTLAFSIKFPFTERSFIDVWHRDPETDGSDDSCGYSFPRLTADQLRRIKDVAFWEEQYPYFLAERSKEFSGNTADLEAMYRSLLLRTADAVGIRLTFEEAARAASLRVHMGGFESPRRQFVFLPGWNTNNPKLCKGDLQEGLMGIMAGMAKVLLAERRPWYRKPKWHVLHWQIRFRWPLRRRSAA